MSYFKLHKKVVSEVAPYSNTPYLDSKIIIEHVLGLKSSQLLLASDLKIDDNQKNQIEAIIERLSKEEPLAYVIGHTDFCGQKIRVTKNTLIPRPETEPLVEKIIVDIQKGGKSELTIFELGLGSGCIPSVVLKSCYDYIQTYQGIDISSNAVLSTSNNISSVLANILAKTSTNSYCGGKLDLISIDFSYMLTNTKLPLSEIDYFISNPPYIKSSVVGENLPHSVVEHEPTVALDGGKDGLKFYRLIRKFLETKTKDLPKVFLEIDTPIATEVLEIFKPLYPNSRIEKDLFGEDRYLIAG